MHILILCISKNSMQMAAQETLHGRDVAKTTKWNRNKKSSQLFPLFSWAGIPTGKPQCIILQFLWCSVYVLSMSISPSVPVCTCVCVYVCACACACVGVGCVGGCGCGWVCVGAGGRTDRCVYVCMHVRLKFIDIQYTQLNNLILGKFQLCNSELEHYCVLFPSFFLMKMKLIEHKLS